MEQKQNYGQLFEKELEKIKKAGNKPTLLLHACCAPCSSYVLEYLNEYFNITENEKSYIDTFFVDFYSRFDKKK